jgi:hypothetical protein
VTTGSGQIITAVYSDDGNGHPDTLLALAMPQDVYVNNGWNEFDMPLTLTPGYYWLALQAQAGIGLRYNNGGTGCYVSNSFGSMPDPFGIPDQYTTRLYSIYGNYCPDIGYLVTATVSPTVSSTPTNTQTFTVTPEFTQTYTPTITTTPTMSIPDPDDDAYAYPLPADDLIRFVCDISAASTDITITIYDFAGNFVKEVKETGSFNGKFISGTVDITRLRPGIYYYLIKAKQVSGGEQKIKIKKFIVKR